MADAVVAAVVVGDRVDSAVDAAAAQEGEFFIGLAPTRLVCERHGGEISVTNTPLKAVLTARTTVSHLTDAVAEGVPR